MDGVGLGFAGVEGEEKREVVGVGDGVGAVFGHEKFVDLGESLGWDREKGLHVNGSLKICF